MNWKANSYQPIAHNKQNEKYAIDVNLNAWKILTISVANNVNDNEWKQEFTQKHFPTNNINTVTKILVDAVKPSNINKRCKIITDNEDNWLYLTIDNGAVLSSIRLPNVDNTMQLNKCSQKQIGVSPRHYITTPGENRQIPQNNIINIVDESSDEENEENNLFQNMKPIQIEDKNNDKPETKKRSNDIIKIIAWFTHIALIVITLSFSGICYLYGNAQLKTINMSNLWCDDNKTLDEIREYNAQNNNPFGEEYSCYQIHGNFINYNTLFDINAYSAYESIIEYENINLVFGIIYGILCIIFVCVVLFDVGYIIWFICKNDKNSECCYEKYKWYHFYIRWFSIDMKMWVIVILILQTIQIIIQSILLLNYGGIDIFKAPWNWSNSDIFIQLPWVIICFAVIILCYGLFICLLWILYSVIPKIMFGFRFAIILFLIDSIFNIIFATFPLFIYQEHINKNVLYSSIGILRVNAIQFVATLYPLILLIYKCYIALEFTYVLSYKGYIDNVNMDPMVKLRNESVANSMHNPNRHSKKLKYDLSSLFIKIHFDDMEQFNVDRIEEKAFKKQDKSCRICLIIFVLCLLIFTGLISISVMVDIEHSKSFCNKFNEVNFDINNINQNNPELMVYNDVCRVKVYKLFNEYSCNCQLVILDNNYLTNLNSTLCQIHEKNIGNITGIDVLNNIFIKWNMMNRFFLDQQKSTADEVIYGCLQNDDNSSIFSLNDKQMFSSQYMELLYIRHLHIGSISSEIAQYWKHIQLLAIPDTVIYAQDISFPAISSLTKLKALQFENIEDLYSNNNKYMLSLCDLNNTLQSLQIDNSYFEILDDCFVDFNHLKYLLLNYDGIIEVNWDILNITTLKRLSLYASNLTFESLNDQFISSNIYENNENLEYVYIGGNPLCESYRQFDSQSAINFILNYNACEDGCSDDCPPYYLQDGFCEYECNTMGTCDFDSGDCSQ